MPNGGSDNCSNCHFNRANKHLDAGQIKGDWFVKTSFCELRSLHRTDPFHTYCRNFTVDGSDMAKETEEVNGPAFAFGLEGRIPWNGSFEPKTISSNEECHECGSSCELGIVIHTNQNESHFFCSDDHYQVWLEQRDSSPSD